MNSPFEDGIYIYDGVWRKIDVDGPYVPEDDGIYVIYFRNSGCPACKAFDKIWNKFVLHNREKPIKFTIAQCTEFFINCNSTSAADTFVFYLIFETPQVVVIVVKDNTISYLEREAGFITYEKLEDFILNVETRMNSHLSEIEEEGGEGIYIDLTERNWKEVVRKIKALLIEGKEVHEVCNQDGCKLFIS